MADHDTTQSSMPAPSGRADPHLNAWIGPYRILSVLGEGGFGVVYLAEQREPVKRRVALKVIRLGMDTDQIIARFEAERQALAMMDHPNIAKVLDAGTTDNGRPFFVMELVRGVPILSYCDSERLTIARRLDLFIHVCNAIQHAHQKGIIHRDIKPSNILITMHDAAPVPKVIDFGIAKAINQELTEKTIYTQNHQMIGSPAYMSPEQAEMSGLDIDTRSDIYSLGALLYELLTGTTPFTQEELTTSGYEHMLRTIREVEPHTPSARLASLTESADRTAQQRRTDLKQLETLLSGDLNWIVMKCLEKDRTRRYDTASALAADIQRHLNDEPVEAGPPTAGYKLRKFVKRNRAQVIAGGVVAGALVAGIIATSIAMGFALNEREKSRALADDLDAELARSNEVKDFLVNMFTDIFPNRAGQVAIEEQNLMAQRLERDVESGSITDPIIETELRLVLATYYQRKSQYPEMLAHAERARTLALENHGEDHPITLTAEYNIAFAYLFSGKGELGTKLLAENLANRARLLGPDHEDTIYSMHSHALGIWLQTDPTQGLQLMQEAAAAIRAHLPPDHRLRSINNRTIVVILDEADRIPEAIAHAEQSYHHAVEHLGHEHRQTSPMARELARLYLLNGRIAEASELLERAAEYVTRVYKPGHTYTAWFSVELARARLLLGRYEEAEELLRRAAPVLEERYGPEHHIYLSIKIERAEIERRTGRYDDAHKRLLDLYELKRRLHGPDHSITRAASDRLATLAQSRGDHEEAVRRFRSTLAYVDNNRGSEERTTALSHPRLDAIRARTGLGVSLHALGNVQEAEKLLTSVYQQAIDLVGPTYTGTTEIEIALANLYDDLGRHAEAEPLRRTVLEVHTRSFGKDHPFTQESAERLEHTISAQRRTKD